MEKKVPGWSLGELAVALGGKLEGDPEVRIYRPVPADSEDPEGITFADNDDYLKVATASGAGAILAKTGSAPTGKPTIYVDRPREAFGRFLAMCQRPLPLQAGVHPTAIVSPEATIGENVSIGPYAVIERDAEIGDGSRIFPYCYVGDNCRLGPNCTLYPHAVLYQDVVLGARCTVHSGAVIGADGFGYAWDGTQHRKIPQVGGVILGDDVEIGVNTAVDRATAGNTLVGKGCKFDNLVQLAHNCQVGEYTVIAALCGISGSAKIGRRNVLAGQVAFNDHVSVADDVILAGRTAVTSNLPKPGTYLGFPARPHGEAMRSLILSTRLPELFQRVKELERLVAAKKDEA